MDTKLLVKALAAHPQVSTDYDTEADVLYLSFGEPRPAEGVDLGSGMVALYDEDTQEIVGLTVIGLRARVERELNVGAAERITLREHVEGELGQPVDE
jgi:uncharacterized protein YuzE